MNSQSIRVIVVEDHTMVRKGLKIVLEEFEGIHVIGEAADGLRAIELIKQLKPDVVLMDLKMPGMDGIQVIKSIMSSQPDQHIIVLTGSTDDENFTQAIRAGAQGYVQKTTSAEELAQAIRNVYAGRPSFDPVLMWRMLRNIGGTGPEPRPQVKLSKREIEVLCLMATGKRDDEIAQELFLTEVTIRTHINRITHKLGLKNRVQATLYGLRSGLVPMNEVYSLVDAGWESRV